MIIGAHAMIFSTNAEADRAFFRDVLKTNFVDAGGGYLIYALPPAEIAVHQADTNAGRELFLLCDSVEALIQDLSARGISCGSVHEEQWGLSTEITLPGGGALTIYQPRHARPEPAGVKSAPKPRRAAKPKAKASVKPKARKAAAKPARKKAPAKKAPPKKAAARKPAKAKAVKRRR